ncbi:dienelactone hydrolase [Variovorax sp. J22R24]|uniref:alpha/beta hydrolase family protein n=1 Tax=Variovorax gracilis TaxID=3053502 RepID=UPI0025760EAF|nr:dienelactone hydrolase [Variovorax sp. J22R24]MDM0104117.1 dienelactone hydrolase [Variovorax sp. J22R24]
MKASTWCRLAMAAACALVSAAQAATGLTVLAAPADSGPVTVFYPTTEPATPVRRGPFTVNVAVDAAPAAGIRRLIVISHGSGGSPWVHTDLTQLLVAAGFTVAMPEHAGDNWHDHSAVGPASWRHRPHEVTQAIDAMAADPRFAPLLDLKRVGIYGMSAGGLTALTLAGARWSPALLARHCEAHLAEDFPTCVGLSTELTGGPLDALRMSVARRVIHSKFDSETTLEGWTDPRIAVAVAAVPMAAPIDMSTLASPRIPLGLVRAGQDAWLAPRWHIDAVRAVCAGCVLVADLADGGHGSILSPPPPDLPPRAARLLNDPPGFDRRALDGVHAAMRDFFIQNLLP